jgi:hypothetical protein
MRIGNTILSRGFTFILIFSYQLMSAIQFIKVLFKQGVATVCPWFNLKKYYN